MAVKAPSDTMAFIKEVAKYFMDFLETDFHKRRNPKRSIQLRNKDNLLVGLNLGKYSSFNTSVGKVIRHGFDKDVLGGIEKGAHRTTIPQNLLNVIRFQIEKISPEQVTDILVQAGEDVQKASIFHKDEYNQALNASLEAVSRLLKGGLVLPFVKGLEKPLENLSLGDENSIYQMEEELTSVLLSLMENKISEAVKFLISDETVDVSKQISSVFSLGEIKSNLIEFFESFRVADLFSEVFEMERNRSILDNQEFYLYFCDISFNQAKYPIFYIPFVITKQQDFLSIEFDSQVYINKRALEFIAQEYNQEKGTKGSLKTISERIIYLAQHKYDFTRIVGDILNEIVNFFGLDSGIDISNPTPQVAKGLWTRISNSCYISLFDKSDEALVNDYEDILRLLASGNSVLGDAFNRLIADFIEKNPKPVNPEVEDEWDNAETSDRLVFKSPIALNSEQRQILSAVQKDDCKYIIVQGPPGTGKSHTITAIAFDAILKNHSILILSDKKEALDVVEEKITDTMNKVRYDRNFQNPILRLGKTGSTYSQILSSAAIDNIKTHYRAVKKDYATLSENIEKISNTLKDDLEAEIITNSEIDLKEIYELFELEVLVEKDALIIDNDEVQKESDAVVELGELRSTFLSLEERLVTRRRLDGTTNQFLQLIDFSFDSCGDPTKLKTFLTLIRSLARDIESLHQTLGQKLFSLSNFQNLTDKDANRLGAFISRYEALKNWLFGYLFCRSEVERLNSEFRRLFPLSRLKRPEASLNAIRDAHQVLCFLGDRKQQLNAILPVGTDYAKLIFEMLTRKGLSEAADELLLLEQDMTYLNLTFPKYPQTCEKAGIDPLILSTYCQNGFTKIKEPDFDKLLRYIGLKQRIQKEFDRLPDSNYLVQKRHIENLVTFQMAHLMDGRVITFYEENKATAKTLRDIIRAKERFPREEFQKLKEAFPCILAGIRDYAEYIPLEPEIFDLVIIDEASQVSIAQAFPALLRAKKVLILGDKKQFSNVKSAQARSDTNREYLNNLSTVFRKMVSDEPARLVKLEKFNIKTSILEFFEFICNYQTQLQKYFRGYKEIISYSNKYFYQNNLQVMKIRGTPIEQVIKFSFTEGSQKQGLLQNSNQAEVELIVDELRKLREARSSFSVGIITPHTNQQKLLIETINKNRDRDYFFDVMHLKIMTFDTCQGEERDIVFYSMVASEESDRLWGIFIQNLESVDIEEDGQIKAQRLNVGFSRAKECMHFVLSKPLDTFTGSIGEALRHYKSVLEEAHKERDVSQVDERSAMEPQVLNWFYQTNFWKTNKADIEFQPQFELGRYLRQLDKSYDHPNYKVDFLLIYKDKNHIERKIIIEYDGFKEHFDSVDDVNELNYETYYSTEDVYREKVLESYGYRFLRINRFNSGQNPIETLNARIERMLKDDDVANSSKFFHHIHQTIEGLQTGEMKECPKCKEIRSLIDFEDKRLTSGYGRFCKFCKVKHSSTMEIWPSQDAESKNAMPESGIVCPRCSSSMVLRTGRFGKFYGCSRFPYCKGTRPVEPKPN